MAKPTETVRLYIDFLEKEVEYLNSAYNRQKRDRHTLLNRLHQCEQDLSDIKRDLTTKERKYAVAHGISDKLRKKLVEAKAALAQVKNKHSKVESKVMNYYYYKGALVTWKTRKFSQAERLA